MNAQEKAKQMVNSIYETLLKNDHLQSYNAAKECALIAVDELVKTSDWYDYADGNKISRSKKNYWQSVKDEIGRL
jgi:hypothetical protein